ncbi:DUF368 domain-containing protein [Dethiosulfatarculus sandiegensis]|uniref:DUF368 domain-containing protein n=1 Tax=Dethiosulfatarculus sandiegensis TaxID=1429043 RepID=A0A0D2GJV4_9BACT|nr:DUF368 domain-containing protein [Dethiosulfatarculus sandiegensis]KIX15007.1 hypothetical protein X474_05975 [Dethiosulfatarculus sandiegensis]
MTFKQAFLKSPGPDSGKAAFVLWLKGFCMGGADIIPGVSGGTIAFITGIYSQLIDAIRSFNLVFIKKIITLDLKSALAEAHLRFLLPLLFGIGLAIVSTSRIIHYFLDKHPVEIWSLFFGLIAASIVVVGRQLKSVKPAALGVGLLGVLVGYLVVGMIPVTTPDKLWFVFICGVISICAMILPGISGAFILLLLGKYAYITGAMKNPFDLGNLLIILVFLCGAALGLSGFSRVLHFLFSKFHDATIAMLTGFMLGAMRKIWPWKEVLETRVIRGKEYVLAEQNVLPPAWDGDFFLAVGLMLLGFILVLALDRLSRKGGS